MTTFFTSDLHFGHRLVSGIRGFEDTDAHDAAIIDHWAETVKEQDIVWVLGDLAISNTSHRRALEALAALPGRKHFISGNHDPVHPMFRKSRSKWEAEFHEVFETVQPFARVKVSGFPTALSHFPLASWGDGAGRPGSRHDEWRLPDVGQTLIHGHTHGKEKVHGRQLHVGWDAWGRFVPESFVAKWLQGLGRHGLEMR